MSSSHELKVEFTVVCVSVSRYQEEPEEPEQDKDSQPRSRLNPLKPPPRATASTSKAVTIMTVISGRRNKRPWKTFVSCFYFDVLTTSRLCTEVACLVGLCVILTQAIDSLAKVEAWSVALVCILGIVVLINTALTFMQPQNSIRATFMVKHNYVLERLWPLFPSKTWLQIWISVFADAFSSVFTCTEYIHQFLPDGPVRPGHVDQIRYLDGSG